MSDDLVKQCIKELQDLVECRCHDAYKGRGLHDPTCCCDYAEALKTVADRIEELEAKLAKAVEALKMADQAIMENTTDQDLLMWGEETVDHIRNTLAELKGQGDE